MDGVSAAWVRASDVREQLRRLGRDDISDDAIDRFLARRRRDARERRRRGGDEEETDYDDDVDDASSESASISTSESDEIPPRRRGASTIVDRRPPWNGDAFEVIPAERAATSSARLDALPRRGGKIDVVQVNAAYARAWSSKAGAPTVVSGERRQKVGFAEKFRAAHEREALRKTRAAAAARRRRR